MDHIDHYKEIDTGAVDYVHDKIILYWDTERMLVTDDAYTDFNLTNVDTQLSITSFRSVVEKRGFDVSEHGEITHRSNGTQTIQNMVDLIKDLYVLAGASID